MKRWEWIKFLGIEPDAVGIEVMKQEFPWDDVDTCMDNEVETPIEGLTQCPNCGKELRWIRFHSPSRTSSLKKSIMLTALTVELR
jgi:hypothetical protein